MLHRPQKARLLSHLVPRAEMTQHTHIHTHLYADAHSYRMNQLPVCVCVLITKCDVVDNEGINHLLQHMSTQAQFDSRL